MAWRKVDVNMAAIKVVMMLKRYATIFMRKSRAPVSVCAPTWAVPSALAGDSGKALHRSFGNGLAVCLHQMRGLGVA